MNEMITFSKLEKSLAEARIRQDKLDAKHKSLKRLTKRIEAEISAVDESVYIILNQLDILAQEHSLQN